MYPTVAQQPPTYKRLAWHATFHGEPGQVIRTETGLVVFVTEATDQITRILTPEDVAAVTRLGRCDLAAEQRLADLVAGNAPRICTTRPMQRQ